MGQIGRKMANGRLLFQALLNPQYHLETKICKTQYNFEGKLKNCNVSIPQIMGHLHAEAYGPIIYK